ncbi:MAG: hypothetical protein K5683_01395 [Prevotella sp.]|nr:hypothetical protein [Prevotella sp.]
MKKIYTYLFMLLMTVTAAMTFTSCETDDQYEADVLVAGDWQGYLGTYYYDRWGLSGNTYETVIHFCTSGYGATSGRGYEVDYDTRSPFYDYAYCEFTWSVVNGIITLIYDDSMWYPVYISDYTLSHDYFAGYMNDGTRRDIRFKLANVNFRYWDTYRGYYDGYYDDGYYYNDGYYYARTRSADSTAVATDSIPVVNNGKSIMSGAFVKKPVEN